MVISGKVNKVELDTIKFTELRGIESRCIQSLQEFQEGDTIVIIAKGVFRENTIEVDGDLFFVKEQAASDFFERFKEQLDSKVDNSLENT